MATDIEEREINGYTLRIDRLLCVGFGDCIDLAPDLFEFDEEGIATFLEPVPDAGVDHLRAACESCPVDALTLVDPHGEQIAP